MAHLLLPFVFALAASKKLSHNINYNGPFNPYINSPPRRLVGTASASENVAFYHGIASGDATASDLLIWTRVTPPFQSEWATDLDTYNSTELTALKTQYDTISVDWAISTAMDSIDFDCTDSVHCGAADTSSDIDYTLKVVVDGLASNTWYYYQFRVGNVTSDIGRTRTIPTSSEEIESWKFAFGSCKQYAHGYFTNLGDIAAKDDLDMMLWLGDYIYEFPNDALVNGTGIDHIPYPPVFLYELEHYRGRYLQHHLDENVQAAHKQLPWFIMWDDHEVVNDYWKDGAPSRWQNTDLFGVDFLTRKANGYQAFFEWLPVRSIDIDTNGGLHRSYSFGNLFDLIMIDGRSQRTAEAENTTYGASLSVDEHYIWGETQRTWILDELQTSQTRGSQWRLIGNNDVFGQSPPVFAGDEIFGSDNIEGYDAERQIIFDYIINNNIDNVVSMAGGPHTGMAQKVYSTGEPIRDDATSYPIMTEFVLDATSAPKLFEEYDYVPLVDNYAANWSWVSPYIRLQADGYCVMTVTQSAINVEYWINTNTRSLETHSELDVSLCVEDGVVEFVDCSLLSISTTEMVEESTLISTTDDDGDGDAAAALFAGFWCWLALAFSLLLV